MNSSNRIWIEVALWTALIAGAVVLFSGCDLSSNPNPDSDIRSALGLTDKFIYHASTQTYSIDFTEQSSNDDVVSAVRALLYVFEQAYRTKNKSPLASPRQASTGGCPAINFSQASILQTLDVITTTSPKTVLTGVLYRQGSGSFTAEVYSIPAGSANAIGTSILTLPQVQTYFADCRGITLGSPQPHPTILADLPGIMSRDSIVTNLGGSAPYAALKISGSVLEVVLDSQSTLGAKSTKYPLNTPINLLVADFNGDGKRDVAALNQTGPTPAGVVSILLGNGDGTLKPRVDYTVGNTASSMTSLDFNQDGRADLAVVSRGDNQVTVLIANADGTMRPGVAYTVPGNASSSAKLIVAGDFDGDGKADLLALTTPGPGVFNAPGFTLLHGNGDGTFQAVAQKTGYKPGYVPIYLAPADLNKDGKLDLATLNVDGTTSILINSGDGSFPTQTRYLAGTPYTSGKVLPGLFAMDFDDDGNRDLVFATGHPDALHPNPQFTAVIFGNGDGTFRGAPAYEVGVRPSSIASADFNGDGLKDLVTSSPNSIAVKSGVFVQLGKPGGGFQPAVELAIPPNGLFASWVEVADINGDGRADLVTTDGNLIFTWPGNGDGTFQPAANFPGGVLPTGLTTGDFNGDTRPDIVAFYGDQALVPTPPPGGPLSVMLATSKAGGGFNAGVNVPTGLNTVGVAVGDVNNDGKADLVAVNEGDPQVFTGHPAVAGDVSVALGNGNGTLQTAAKYTVGRNPTAVALGDITGDGLLDLIVGTVNAADAKVGVLRNLGNGTFGSPVFFNTYSWIRSLKVADIDGDGKSDLVLVHWSGDSPMTTMRGNGDGTFQPERLLPAGDVPAGVTVADFNGDGRLDLAVANQASLGTGSVSVFHNLAAPSGCGYTLGSNPSPFSASGGTGSFTINAGSACPWTAISSNPDWITITGGASGSGNGTVNFSVAPNTGAARSGNIVAGGQLLSITQSAGSSGGGTPQPGSVSPGAGMASGTQTYTFTFTDTAGYQSLSVLNVLINNFIDGRGACYLAIVPSSANAAAVYLVDDGGNAGGPYQGMTLPGSGTVQNSQCSISGNGSSISGSGTTLTVALSIAFKSPFAGNRVIFVAAREAAGANSGWQALGTVGVPGANGAGPTVGGVNPARSSGSGAQPFTFTFNNTAGYQDLGVLNILINDALNGNQSCYLAYSRSANVLYLINDAGTALLAGLPLNGSGTLGNSQCTVTGSGSSASGSGNALTLTLNLAFSAAYAGNRLIYAAARSNGDLFNSGWQAIGSRTVTTDGGGGGGANLLCNGSFEQPGHATSYITVGVGGNLPCWSVADGNIDVVGTVWQHADGNFSLDMDGLTAGAIAQTFATTPGTAYTAAFHLAGNYGGGNPQKQLQVSAAGQSTVKSFSTAGRNGSNMGWQRETFTFTANAASTTLQFMSLSGAGSASGPALDNVCVTAGTAACTGGGGTQAPSMNVSATALAFGNVTVNQTKDLPVQVSNSGTAALTGSAAVSGAGFTLVGGASFTIQPGAAAQTITVRYSPTTATSATGTLTLVSNDPAKPSVALALTGAGTPAGGGGTGACIAPPATPAGWWSGDGTATDVGGATNGTLQGTATFAPGKVGQAFLFDGVSSSVQLGNPANLRMSTGVTIDAWVKPTSLRPQIAGPPMAAILTKWAQIFTDTPNSDSYGLWLIQNGNSVALFAAIHQAGPSEPTIQGGTIPLNVWSHVAMTFDAASGALRLYVNGQQVASSTHPGALLGTDRNVLIGREDSYIGRNFDGLVDEVEVVNRAMTATEIQAIVNADADGKCKGTNPNPGSGGFAGNWTTTFGPMALAQNGSTVTGTFPNLAGTLNGTVTGNVLNANWSHPSGVGFLVFTLSADGDSFTGSFTCTSSCGSTGPWNGTRVK